MNNSVTENWLKLQENQHEKCYEQDLSLCIAQFHASIGITWNYEFTPPRSENRPLR